MHQKLSEAQIERVSLQCHLDSPYPSVREVSAALRRQFGASGRTARVSEILKRVIERHPIRTTANPDPIALATLQRQLDAANTRARRAEDLERHHQDYWAARYQAKFTEPASPTEPHVRADVAYADHLQLYRKAADLARRLARYEHVESLLDPNPTEPPSTSASR